MRDATGIIFDVTTVYVYACMYVYIYIYICICTRIIRVCMTSFMRTQPTLLFRTSANLPTNIVDFRGLDSSIMLYQRGGIPMSIGDFPESLSQAMLVGTMLVGGLDVLSSRGNVAALRAATFPGKHQSNISKGIRRQGNRLFCKEFQCFNIMPCRPMPLTVHF